MRTLSEKEYYELGKELCRLNMDEEGEYEKEYQIGDLSAYVSFKVRYYFERFCVRDVKIIIQETDTDDPVFISSEHLMLLEKDIELCVL